MRESLVEPRFETEEQTVRSPVFFVSFLCLSVSASSLCLCMSVHVCVFVCQNLCLLFF